MSNSRSKIFFASDFHLGVPSFEKSREREDKIVAWLNSIEHEAKEIYLLGDIFDFWFEYKNVVPKGFVRLLGKLAQLADNGVVLNLFIGNHDLWMKNYFKDEIGIHIYDEPLIRKFGDKTLYLAHGDGLGPGDHGFKLLKRIFKGKLNQWFFRWIHPDIGISVADFFSGKSRAKNNKTTPEFYDENEWLVVHSRDILKTEHIDYFVYGHRHYPKEYPLNEYSTFVNLGDWITHFTYAEFDGAKLELKKFS